MAVITRAQFRKLTGKRAFVRARAHKRHVPGQMNQTEAAYSQYLHGLKAIGKIADYRFEAIRLRLAEKTTLTVDFLVIDNDGFIELVDTKAGRKRKSKAGIVVGTSPIAEDDSIVKLKVAAEMYPWFRFVMTYQSRQTGQWERREF